MGVHSLKKKKKSTVVQAFSPEAVLKRKVRDHLRRLGFVRTPEGTLSPPSSSKESIRQVHREHRRSSLRSTRDMVRSHLPQLLHYFANGSEVDPTRIKPRLELIESDTWQSRLFRLASLSWSVPVSAGFGRRMRYLVWDDSNNKLIGIMALGDPVFNLKVRDERIEWDTKDRASRLVNILDAYVLGAVPPYNMLLGGKLVACLVRTKEVRDDFAGKYGKSRGIISRKKKGAQLVMVTTSSSLGKSSIYNRLKLGGHIYFEPIGYTQGWGHFHVPDTLFSDLRNYLRKSKHEYVDGHGFGQGPNWRLRTIRAAFNSLGFKGDLLKHGIGREVFACELASNAAKILRGENKRPQYKKLLTVEEVGALARERWIIPRAERQPEFKDWKRNDFKNLILNVRSAQSSASSATPAKAKVG